MVAAFETEFPQRLTEYGMFEPLKDLDIITELSDLNESLKVTDFSREEKLKSLVDIKSKINDTDSSETETISTDKLRKSGLSSVQLSSGRWTSEEILLLIKSILLFGEQAGFAKSKTLKRTMAEKKLKWMSLKHQLKRDVKNLNPHLS